MELKTILNRVCRLPGFVYGRFRLVRAGEQNGPDCLAPQRFQFVPVLGLPTCFV